MLYVFTSGEYSDYRISVILESVPNKNIQFLLDMFTREVGGGADEWEHDTDRFNRVYLPNHVQRQWSDKFGLTEVWSNGRHHAADWLYIFAEWLVRFNDFKRLDYDETNFD